MDVERGVSQFQCRGGDAASVIIHCSNKVREADLHAGFKTQRGSRPKRASYLAFLLIGTCTVMSTSANT